MQMMVCFSRIWMNFSSCWRCDSTLAFLCLLQRVSVRRERLWQVWFTRDQFPRSPWATQRLHNFSTQRQEQQMFADNRRRLKKKKLSIQFRSDNLMTLSLYNYTGKIPGFHQQQFLIGVENKIELGLYCTNCWIFFTKQKKT